MASAFQGCIGRANKSPDVRVVIITGAGRSFCVGADTQQLGNVVTGQRPNPWRRHAALTLRDLNKPAIAAINGGCAAIGIVIALLCDVRFAAAGAKLTTIFARRGMAAEYGCSWLLARTIGVGHAADLLLSGRTITAEQALEMRLVNRVYGAGKLEAETRAYALDMAENCSPEAMLMLKQQLHSDLENSFEKAVLHSAALIDHANKTDDFREGVASFVEKRPPRFAPLHVE
jgi:enoyl-CoA hydratase/carnithine racemase